MTSRPMAASVPFITSLRLGVWREWSPICQIHVSWRREIFVKCLNFEAIIPLDLSSRDFHSKTTSSRNINAWVKCPCLVWQLRHYTGHTMQWYKKEKKNVVTHPREHNLSFVLAAARIYGWFNYLTAPNTSPTYSVLWQQCDTSLKLFLVIARAILDYWYLAVCQQMLQDSIQFVHHLGDTKESNVRLSWCFGKDSKHQIWKGQIRFLSNKEKGKLSPSYISLKSMCASDMLMCVWEDFAGFRWVFSSNIPLMQVDTTGM